MEETLKMMKSILLGKEGKASENELINEYQQKLSPNILAYFYVNNFGLIINISNNYKIIIDEDKASFCLQELDKCLQNYDLSNDTKFITYFITCYKRRLYAEVQMLNHKIRKANMFCEDINELEISKSTDLITDDDYILSSYNLTNEEIKQCKLLNMGYTIKEIASILKLAPITIYKRNDKIKQKILNLNINFA